MKARDWQRYLETERKSHGKTVFTVTELANASGSKPHVLNVELDRLCKQGIIVRYARGRYGLPEAVTPETLLPHLDAHAYITGAFALHRHNLITQMPVEITCFTNRRHNRSRVRTTPVGRFTFVCVQPPVYAPPAEGVVAGPEQALCDYVFLMRRRGVAPASQVTFRGLHGLDTNSFAERAARYSKSAQQEAAGIVNLVEADQVNETHRG
jgi:hypothetical protein